MEPGNEARLEQGIRDIFLPCTPPPSLLPQAVAEPLLRGQAGGGQGEGAAAVPGLRVRQPQEGREVEGADHQGGLQESLADSKP